MNGECEAGERGGGLGGALDAPLARRAWGRTVLAVPAGEARGTGLKLTDPRAAFRLRV